MIELIQIIWAVIQVMILFFVVIMIHELGHFLFAKLFGVKVESFNIGFGTKEQRLWHKQIGETDYSIRPWPLGGFVQLHGQFRPEEMEALEGGKDKDKGDDAEKEGEDKKKSLSEMAYDDVHALREKPYYVKLLVFSAGVAFNFLSVALVLGVMNFVGREVPKPPPPKLDIIEENSPLYESGLRRFDLIAAVNGEVVKNSQNLLERLDAARKTKPFEAPTVTVKRDGGTETLTLSREATNPELYYDKIWMPAKAGDVGPLSPADEAGIKAGDVIVAIDGQPIQSWGEMTRIIRAHPEKELVITLDRDGEIISRRVTPMEAEQDGETIGLIGVTLAPSETVRVRVANPVIAFVSGFEDAGNLLVAQAVGLARIFGSGETKKIRRNLGGPVGILDALYKQARKGFTHLLDFFCLLSVALVIFNILPIPLLDGGHILQATIEVVIRRPIPPRALIWMYNAALIFLLAFVLLVSANDFWRLGKRWFGAAEVETPAQLFQKIDGATTGTIEHNSAP